HHGVGAAEGGVADVMELTQVHIREHADVHRVFHIDAAADAAGHIDAVNHIHRHIHAFEQGINGGENSAFGPDKVVDIYFIDGDFPTGFTFLSRSQHIAAHAVAVPLYPAAFPNEQSLGIDDAGTEQL